MCKTDRLLYRDEFAARVVERQLLKLKVLETGGIDLARRSSAKLWHAARPVC
jgi:hypothetical protein